MAGETASGLSVPSGAARTFEHMGAGLWPVPRQAPADKHVESGWCHRNGLCQHFLCFLYATCPAEGRSKPACPRPSGILHITSQAKESLKQVN